MPEPFERRLSRLMGVRIAGRLLLAVLASALISSAPAAAVTMPPLESVSASSLPANAYAQDNLNLPKTACGTEYCESVGWYEYAPSTSHGLIMSIRDGVAGASQPAPLPANAGVGQVDGLQAVSCWSLGSCIAAGYYYDSSGNEQALVVPITNGVPGTPQEVTLPANHSATAPSGQLAGIACLSSGSCIAVGSYEDTAGGTDSLSVTVDDGVAAPGVEVPAPANGASPQNAELEDVACQADGSCVAVGWYYYDTHNHYHPMVVPITGGTPGAAAQVTQLPSNIDSYQTSYLLNVACPPAGTCSAVGYYYDSSETSEHDFAIPISAGVPGRGVEAPPPAGASSAVASFYGLACQAGGACLAAGLYGASGTNVEAVAIPISNGVPAPAVEISLPADAYVAGAQDAELHGVACPAAGPCLAVGSYRSLNADYVPLTLSFDAGTVGAGTETQTPSDAITDPNHAGGWYMSDGCGATSCAAAGQYANATADVPFALSVQGQLAVSTASLPGGLVSADYSQTLMAVGAWGSYSWSLASGQLPAGLSLDSQTGVISGRPTTPGSSSFTVQVTGTGVPAQTATQSLTVTVAAARLRVLRGSAQVRRNRFGLRLGCSTAHCGGVAKLEVTEVTTVRHGKRRVRRHRTIVIATAAFAIPAGGSRVLTVTLDRAGRRLLAAHHHLSARVVATVDGVIESAGRLTLRSAPAKHGKRHRRH